MFLNTQPFIPKFHERTNNKFRLKTGPKVPRNAVNLSHYHIPKLDPDENVIIGDTSRFIIENIKQPKDVMTYVDSDNRLKVFDKYGETDASMDSELVEITDKFYQGVPLYYKHELKYLHYDVDSGLEGSYHGGSIYLVDENNNQIPSSYKYKVILGKADVPDGMESESKYNNLYKVEIYTSFQIENNYLIKAVYNAIDADDEDGSINIIPGYDELINPQAFYHKAKSIMEATTAPDKFYIQKSPEKVKSSYIYTSGVFEDPRVPQLLDIKVLVTMKPMGEAPMVLTFELNQVPLLNKASAIGVELDDFIGDKQKLTELTVAQLTNELVPESFRNREIIGVSLEVVNVDRDRNTINVSTNPNGSGFILGQTSLDTGRVTNVPDIHYKKRDNKILTGHSVRFKDRNPIRVLTPREDESLENWYIRVQNGRFVIEGEEGKKFHYFMPEYYRQHYDEEYGFPYKKVQDEVPLKISNKAIKIKNAPLYVETDAKGQPTNLVVYRVDAYSSKWPLNVNSWNNKDGVIVLDDFVSDNDDIYVNYVFEEESYVYRGYERGGHNGALHNIILDCNPNKHHMMTSYDEMRDSSTDIPSFGLIDKVIYLYMRPAIIESATGTRIHNKQTLFHLTELLTKVEMGLESLILVGKIYVRPNSSYYSLKLTDTRSRGGGILEEINDSLRMELEPQSDYYWDIGYWDGEAYPENSVIVVRLDRRVLKQFGGKLTEGEVEKKAYKHVAAGTLILLEFVSTNTDEDYKLNNLDITSKPMNRLDFKPTLMLSTELNNDTSVISLEVVEPKRYNISYSNVFSESVIPKPSFVLGGSPGKPKIVELISFDDMINPEIMDIQCKTLFELGPIPSIAKVGLYKEILDELYIKMRSVRTMHKPAIVGIKLEIEEEIEDEKN